MADRFFPNLMPDITETQQEEDRVTSGSGDSLMRLLSMPYPSLTKLFQRSDSDGRHGVEVGKLWKILLFILEVLALLFCFSRVIKLLVIKMISFFVWGLLRLVILLL